MSHSGTLNKYIPSEPLHYTAGQYMVVRLTEAQVFLAQLKSAQLRAIVRYQTQNKATFLERIQQWEGFVEGLRAFKQIVCKLKARNLTNCI